jgi:hypothetical protein
MENIQLLTANVGVLGKKESLVAAGNQTPDLQAII